MDTPMLNFRHIVICCFGLLVIFIGLTNATYYGATVIKTAPNRQSSSNAFFNQPRNSSRHEVHRKKMETYNSNQNEGQYLRCHDCAKQGCEDFILRHPNRTGKCETDIGEGKCFIRKDPNTKLYWGCIDDYFWPDVPWRTFNGCTEDWDRAWTFRGVRRPIVWCFCDTEDCNINIDRLNQTSGGGNTRPPGGGGTDKPPTVGPEKCYYSYNHANHDHLSCDQACDVIRGKAVCSCWEGFVLQADQRTCKDMDECVQTGGGCSHSCVNTYGSYYCMCDRGYTIAADRRTCQDINECQMSNGGCSDSCTNLVGSYLCQCSPGYFLSADGRQCQDINECMLQIHGCEGLCTNTPGSYMCECRPGYTKSLGDNSCTDLDECSLGTHLCSQRCYNTYGSYYCECLAGYTLNLDNKTCLDINECYLPGQGGCQQLCINAEGSFYCGCNLGFYLSDDKISCFDQDECIFNNGGCEQVCFNYPGGYTCQCLQGYELSPNNITCQDIDECYFNNGGCSQLCVNDPGSYHCECFQNDIYAIGSDGKTCTSICPDTFFTGYQSNTCYKIFSPTLADKSDAKDYHAAERECQKLHPLAHLISMDDVLEKEFIASQLRLLGTMLDGWQGWWTSAEYNSIAGEFIWDPIGVVIDTNNPLWTFKKDPYEDTCLWIMQVASYDHTWGNFECETKSGYICEINIPRNN